MDQEELFFAAAADGGVVFDRREEIYKKFIDALDSRIPAQTTVGFYEYVDRKHYHEDKWQSNS